jgi:hypothetical protein
MLLAVTATAQLAAQTRQLERQGFFIGGGLGYGSLGLTCDLGCSGLGREGGVSGFIHLGGAVSQQLLLGVESNGWYKKQNGATVTMGTLTATAIGYPSKTVGFFVRGGAGIGMLHADDGTDSASDTGFGGSAGLGYDIPIGSRTALTPFANWFFGSFNGGGANTLQVGLGINAY